MSLPKICGIETEYGILASGSDMGPTMASSMLINAYIDPHGALGRWNFLDEHPDVDARGVWDPSSQYPHVEALMANAILKNGARYYVDHAHPEYSTPECASVRSLLAHERAGDEIIRRSMQLANDRFGNSVDFIVHKNNSDGKGNSYGCHENYLVNRDTPFGRIARGVMAHFVTRQLYCGAGKVGVECAREAEPRIPFQLSQRADFFEEEIGLETTVRRPIINTRDEPHGDPGRFRRLHVIAGDANMSEWATFMKVGTTALLLAAVEDGQYPDWLTIQDPVTSIRRISHGVSIENGFILTSSVTLADGRVLSALDIQRELLECARSWFKNADTDPTGGDGQWVLDEWDSVLSDLSVQPMKTSDRVDWVAKATLVAALASRHSVPLDGARSRAIDFQYHDLRPTKNLSSRVGLRSLVATGDVTLAIQNPPEETRAYFRGRCVEKFEAAIVNGNWDSLVFDVEREHLVRVPMNDPMRGTKALVGGLLDRCHTAAELIDLLDDTEVERYDNDPGW